MPWVGLQCVIVVFPDHTHLPYFFDVVNDVNLHVFGKFYYHFIISATFTINRCKFVFYDFLSLICFVVGKC